MKKVITAIMIILISSPITPGLRSSSLLVKNEILEMQTIIRALKITESIQKEVQRSFEEKPTDQLINNLINTQSILNDLIPFINLTDVSTNQRHRKRRQNAIKKANQLQRDNHRLKLMLLAKSTRQHG